MQKNYVKDLGQYCVNKLTVILLLVISILLGGCTERREIWSENIGDLKYSIVSETSDGRYWRTTLLVEQNGSNLMSFVLAKSSEQIMPDNFAGALWLEKDLAVGVILNIKGSYRLLKIVGPDPAGRLESLIQHSQNIPAPLLESSEIRQVIDVYEKRVAMARKRILGK